MCLLSNNKFLQLETVNLLLFVKNTKDKAQACDLSCKKNFYVIITFNDVNEHFVISQNYRAHFFIDGENLNLPETQQVYRMIEGSKLGEIILLEDAVDDDIGRNGKITYSIVDGKNLVKFL